VHWGGGAGGSAMTMTSEIRAVPGATLVAPLPAAVQLARPFAGAISARPMSDREPATDRPGGGNPGRRLPKLRGALSRMADYAATTWS